MPSEIACKAASRPSAQQISTINELLDASIISSFQAASICSKRFESSGSWERISALCMKMGSKRHHLAWTFVQTPSAPSIARSFPLHSSTTGLQNSIKRPWEVMPIISNESLSNFSMTSPSSPRSGQSGLEQSKDTGILDQVARMAESFFSIFASLTLWSTTSETSSANSWSLRSSKSLKQNSGPFSKDFWVIAMMLFQCLSRMVSPCKSFTNGSTVAMFLTSSVSHL